MESPSAVPQRGMRIFSVSSGSVSLASFSFRLSLDDRFHRMPEQTKKTEGLAHWLDTDLISHETSSACFQVFTWELRFH